MKIMANPVVNIWMCSAKHLVLEKVPDYMNIYIYIKTISNKKNKTMPLLKKNKNISSKTIFKTARRLLFFFNITIIQHIFLLTKWRPLQQQNMSLCVCDFLTWSNPKPFLTCWTNVTIFFLEEPPTFVSLQIQK